MGARPVEGAAVLKNRLSRLLAWRGEHRALALYCEAVALEEKLYGCQKIPAKLLARLEKRIDRRWDSYKREKELARQSK